ncbi:ImmA/IrrE family metallo-endopeptidase [Cytobacillus citreus]|nr:ImmA/IrrE family metallo-endopeptidase [Cytobacillus citreus]
MPREKKLAQRIIRKNSLVPPINVVETLKKYADYVEDDLPSEVDAICIMTKKPLVIVHKFQAPNRKRFTLAHELGHIIMPWHHGMISCHTDTEDIVDGTAYQKMENEANSFAAELLMPSTWLKDIIDQYEKQGVEKLVDIVATKAEVSRSAAFYSIIAQLPSGYYMYLDYHLGGFISTKKSPGTEVYVPYQDYSLRIKWLKTFANASNQFELDNVDIYYWKVENNLSAEELSYEVSKVADIGLGDVIQNILKYGKGTFPSIFFQLINLLPPGYIMMVVQGEYQETYSSPGTKIHAPYKLGKVNLIHWFNKYSEEWGTFSILDYDFYWAQFIIQVPSALDSIDNRLSKDILKDILKECYPREEERRRYLYKINGVVGALNNEAPDEFEDYYRMFRERFVGTIFEKINNHLLFESFIINKINEMMARKKKK